MFNVEQIDDLPEHYYAKPAPHGETVKRVAHAEKFFAATRATVCHGGTISVTHDYVQMPPFESFRDAESYDATLAHEAAHWTRQHRASTPILAVFSDEGYAVEELVAELGSAFLAPEVRDDHVPPAKSTLRIAATLDRASRRGR